MRLKQISLSKLLKSELHSMVDDLICIMEGYDARALYIEDSYKMLIRHEPQVDTLGKKYGPCKYVKEQSKFHTKRLEYAGFIYNQVQNISRIKGESLERETHIASLLVRLHLLGIRKRNRTTVNGNLWGFFNSIDEDSEIKNAFEVLGLLSYVEELREIDNSFHQVHILKMDARSARQKSHENKSIQKKGQDILRIFFAQVQQAQESSELKEDYASLYSELNHLIPEYTKKIRTRATLNKKRAAAKAKAKAADQAEPKTHILSVNGKETGSVTIVGKKKEVEKKAVVRKGKKGKQNKNNAITVSQIKKTDKENNKTPLPLVPAQKRDENGVGRLTKILKLPPEKEN